MELLQQECSRLEYVQLGHRHKESPVHQPHLLWSLELVLVGRQHMDRLLSGGMRWMKLI